MAQSLLELIFKTSKQGQGGKAAAAELKEVKGAVGEITSGLGLFNVGSLTAAGAIAGLGAFAASSVKEWSAYAEEMGKAAELSGVTAEEMSRLIQAGDDMRIPAEKLTTAFALANKNGFQPTIENLADLADRMKGIHNPTQRAAELNKIFGRGWAEIYPLLKDGGQAIRDGTAAIEDSLVVTDKAVEANREYIAELDNISDQWQGVKNTAGQALIPILGDVLGYVNDGTAALKEQDTAWGRILAGVPLVGQVYLGIIGNQYAQEEATRAQGKALLDFNTSMDVGAGYAETFGDTVGEIPEKIQDLGPTLTEIKDSFRELTAEMIFNKAAADLDAEAALALGRSMGLVDETTLGTMGVLDRLTEKYDINKDGVVDLSEATKGYIDEVLALTGALDALDGRQIDIMINIDRGGSASAADLDALGSDYTAGTGEPGETKGYANAGAVTIPAGFPHDTFNLPLSSGETAYVVNDRMRWTGEGAQMGGEVLRIENVNIYGEMSYKAFLGRLREDLPSLMRS